MSIDTATAIVVAAGVAWLAFLAVMVPKVVRLSRAASSARKAATTREEHLAASDLGLRASTASGVAAIGCSVVGVVLAVTSIAVLP